MDTYPLLSRSDIAGEVSIRIYDLKGSMLATPFRNFLPAGKNTVKLDVNNLQSGIYTCEVDLGKSGKLKEKIIITH